MEILLTVLVNKWSALKSLVQAVCLYFLFHYWENKNLIFLTVCVWIVKYLLLYTIPFSHSTVSPGKHSMMLELWWQYWCFGEQFCYFWLQHSASFREYFPFIFCTGPSISLRSVCSMEKYGVIKSLCYELQTWLPKSDLTEYRKAMDAIQFCFVFGYIHNLDNFVRRYSATVKLCSFTFCSTTGFTESSLPKVKHLENAFSSL